MSQRAKRRTLTRKVGPGGQRPASDLLAAEEPLELRLCAGENSRTLAVTMRTPGQDFELVAGFLLAEGVIRSRDDLKGLSYCVDNELDARQRYNIVNADLRGDKLSDLPGLERHFFTNSACGVCGRSGLDNLEARGLKPLTPDFQVSPELLTGLPSKLREAQGLFELTGGLHAAALFNPNGELLALREDVGRHNALDKLLGWALLEDKLPLSEHLLLLSGRSSYELLQKALVAGVSFVAAVSAPSSLAVDVAKRFGITLVGFLRGETFNIYANEERLKF